LGSNHQGHIRPFNSLLAAVFRATDILIIISTFFLLSLIFGVNWSDHFTLVGSIAIIMYIIVAELTALYASWRVVNLSDENKQVILTWLVVVFGLLVIAYASKTSSVYSRRVLLSWMIVTPIILSIFRLFARGALRTLRKRNRNSRKAVIIGAGSQALQLLEQIESQPWRALKIDGFYDNELPIGYKPQKNSALQVLGTCNDLMKEAKNSSIDIVFVALPIIKEKEIKEIIAGLSDTTVVTYIVPDLFMSELLNTRWGYMGNLPLLSIHDRPFHGIDNWVKRFEDIIFGSLILMTIAIPMGAIALAIKLTSKGPVIFKQHRYGITGKEITVWKFRTMNVCENGDEIKQATKVDKRITKLGKFLRASSLDELPQFINVISGSMSIVGPRPHAVAHNELYRKEINGYMLRHSIKPGITGWAQINGWRGETDTLHKMEKRVEHDHWYIKNWTIWLDIKIIFRTVLYGFTGKQAY